MAGIKLSEWRVVGADGSIPEELLPAAYVQYRWALTYIWTPDDSWGVSGRRFKMNGELKIAALEAADEVTFVCTVLVIPWVGNFWTYYPGTMKTTGPEDCPTWGGDQMWWEYDPAFGDVGFGIEQLFIVGWLYSPIYQLDVPAGAKFEGADWRPQYAIDGSWALEVRTAPGGGRVRVDLKDHAAGDIHKFRVHKQRLLAYRWLGAYERRDGVVSGLGVAPGDGLAVVVAAGEAYVGHEPMRLDADVEVAVEGDATNLVFVRPSTASGMNSLLPELAVVVTQGGAPEGAVYLLAEVQAGSDSVPADDIDEEGQGTLVAEEVDDYAVVLHEDGRLEVSVDRGSERDVVYESGDRGLTWVRV